MKYFHLIFFFVILISCNKVGGTRIKGKVIDIATGQPMPNMRVVAVRYPLISSYRSPDEDITDENGNFELRLWYRMYSDYYCQVIKGTGYMPDNSIHGTLSDVRVHRGRQEITFKLCYKAYLKWDLVNLNCQPTDTLKIWVENALGGYPYVNTIMLVGCDSFQSLQYVDVPYHQWNLHWQVIENGVTTDYYDSFYLNPGEEKTYSILY